MRIHTTSFAAVIFATFCCFAGHCALLADEPNVPARLDRAGSTARVVEKAIGYLNGPGDELESGRSCVTCHHAPLRRWALREAARIGIKTDTEALADATDQQPAKLSKISRSNPWAHSLSSFYLVGNADGPRGSVPENAARELADIIIAAQSADGSWKAAQQFGNQRRPKHDANEAQTIWSVLALSRADLRQEAIAARDKGLAWLKSAERGSTIDARALRLIVEKRWGEADRREDLLKEFIASQDPDGGWGWQPDDPSDAWATGLVLYALSEAGNETAGTAIDAARAFMFKSQQQDGSWLVEGKLTENPEMASYFGTVWAIIGLSRIAGSHGGV